MPVVRDEGGSDAFQDVFGLPPTPPPPPAAPPTLGGSPIVSSTPQPGQGLATDSKGRVPVNVAVQSIVFTTADPVSPVIGQIWYRQDTSQLCVRHDSSTTKRVTLA